MKRTYRVTILSVIATSIVVVSAVCWHSLEEIHYLKSFYPQQFTVEEAFYASAVELIKILIIGLPFVLSSAPGFTCYVTLRKDLDVGCRGESIA